MGASNGGGDNSRGDVGDKEMFVVVTVAAPFSSLSSLAQHGHPLVFEFPRWICHQQGGIRQISLGLHVSPPLTQEWNVQNGFYISRLLHTCVPGTEHSATPSTELDFDKCVRRDRMSLQKATGHPPD